MPYSNITLVQKMVAQALTSSTPQDLIEPVDLLKIGNVFDSNLITDDIVLQYISWADNDINARLSVLYRVPLKELADFDTTLFTVVEGGDSGGSNTNEDTFITETESPFEVGDIVVFVDGDYQEKHTIAAVLDYTNNNLFQVVEDFSYAFQNGSRILRVSYPNPITLISTRFAAANIYEKYFMSQSSPNESEYGKLLREQADKNITDILNGQVVLIGQQRVGGTGFYDPNLTPEYGLRKGAKRAMKVSFEGFDKISKLADNLSKSKNLDKPNFINSTRIADTDINALLDALYIAKQEENEKDIREIVKEITKRNKDNSINIEKELSSRYVREILESMFKV